MITALLCLLPILQDVEALIEKLSHESVEVRAEAASALKKAGPRALPKLRAALEKASDAGVKTALKDIVAAVELEETLAGLKYEVVLPKAELTLANARKATTLFVVRITNGGPREITLWTGIHLEIVDATGATLEPSSSLGRFGLRPRGCFLKHFEFKPLAAGGSMELTFALANYLRDPDVVAEWTLPKAGEYTLRFKTSFDRAEFKARCEDACAGHDNADSPWNRALELTREFSAKVTVKE